MVLGGMLDPLKSAVKFHKEIDKDNFTFKLFYRASYGLCILASTLVGASAYIGDPIECNQDKVDEGVFEDHCWIHGTERIGVGKANEREIQEHFGCIARPDTEDKDNTTVFYQWVIFAMLISAGLFKLPYIIWKLFEGGLMKSFYDKEAKSIEFRKKKDETDNGTIKETARFFNQLKGSFRSYYFAFLACEMFNVGILLVIWVSTDKFLHGNFHNYGAEVYGELVTKTVDFNVMCNAFPTATSCTFNQYGSGGTPEHINGICILSQNIINQKIYLVLWFWYILVLLIGVVQLVFEAIVIAVPAFRNLLITWNMGKNVTPNAQKFLNRSCNIGDWFVLYQLRKNTDKQFFCLLLDKLGKDFNPTGQTKVQTQVNAVPLYDNKAVEMEMKNLESGSGSAPPLPMKT